MPRETDGSILHQRPPFPKIETYIGECCREWVLASGVPVGRCGLCGERPTYKRPDDREVPDAA